MMKILLCAGARAPLLARCSWGWADRSDPRPAVSARRALSSNLGLVGRWGQAPWLSSSWVFDPRFVHPVVRQRSTTMRSQGGVHATSWPSDHVESCTHRTDTLFTFGSKVLGFE